MISRAYTEKLGLTSQSINVSAQKIDGLPLGTYGMVIAEFLVQNKLGKAWFFKGTFLLADISIELLLGMPFLSFRNANLQFDAGKLTWKTYIADKAMPTVRQVKLIDKHEFAKTALNENSKTFVIHMSALDIKSIYLSQVAQIAAL